MAWSSGAHHAVTNRRAAHSGGDRRLRREGFVSESWTFRNSRYPSPGAPGVGVVRRSGRMDFPQFALPVAALPVSASPAGPAA